MYRKILVPLDGSSLAEAVLPHVRALAKCMSAEVVLLTVPVYPVRGFTVADPLLLQSLAELTRSNAAEYLQGVTANLKGDGLSVSYDLRDGPVAQTILDFSGEIHADLVAMATHGRGGFTRFLLGSVADQVVQRSSAPVLLIRPEQVAAVQPLPAETAQPAEPVHS